MSMPAEEMHPTQSLARLLQGYADAPPVAVAGIASDSRQLDNGYLFLACAGEHSHGLDYLEQARAAGICAVAWDASTAAAPTDIGVPMVAVENLGHHLGEIGNRYYGSPSNALGVVGVTGTNGKTTVAWMIAQCMQRLETSCAYIGTLGYGIDELQGAEGMTTPAAIELLGRLANFVDCGATHAVIEVSSHALSQRRIDGIDFEAVLFTNLTRDHLDYHGDMRAYFESKARLFRCYDSRIKIVNIDSEFGAELAAFCGPKLVSVSTNYDRIPDDDRRYVIVRSAVPNEYGTDISITSSWGDARFALPLPGDFNVANAAIVLAYLLSHGVAIDAACDVLELADAPPGRLQRVAPRAPVYVDYAHTPDAIESALKALRPHCHGELWCVFGCGGDRDAGKRPQMGRLAERFADKLVVTNDNPRSERPQEIIDEIVAGFARNDAATVIEDRAAAINWAISNAAAPDVILIAGKGHEQFQEIEGRRLRFSDHDIALTALKAKGGVV